jgi:hypothetical protein
VVVLAGKVLAELLLCAIARRELISDGGFVVDDLKAVVRTDDVISVSVEGDSISFTFEFDFRENGSTNVIESWTGREVSLNRGTGELFIVLVVGSSGVLSATRASVPLVGEGIERERTNLFIRLSCYGLTDILNSAVQRQPTV